MKLKAKLGSPGYETFETKLEELFPIIGQMLLFLATPPPAYHQMLRLASVLAVNKS